MTQAQESLARFQARREEALSKVDVDLSRIPEKFSGNVTDIPRQCLSQEDIGITESSAQSLLASLAQGAITATAVTKAFLRRAVVAQKLVNCVHELLPERALARAKELDEYFAKHKKPIGPLHGLPVSVKAHMGVKGCDTSSGFVAWTGRESPDDAELLKILIAAGAVEYVRTTEPQALLMLETISNVTGETVNPHNTALTPGGSSGGESALQALYGSPLGIGTDMGGSIRSPASNCGLYGFKPTTHRIPLTGWTAYNIGVETIWGSAGPLCPTFEGIDLMMKVILDAEPWRKDPSLHQVRWREQPQCITPKGEKKFRVGVMWDDGIVKPLPPVTRALHEVVAKLKLVPGVEVVEWKPFHHDEAMEILAGLYSPDGGKSYEALLQEGGESALQLANWVAKESPAVKAHDLPALWNLLKKREAYRFNYLAEWNKLEPDMDVILCPAHPNVAPVLSTSRYWGYTSIWNILDYPAIVFPVTRINAQLDPKETGYTPRNDDDALYQDNYDPVVQASAPVCLQLVGKKMQDEMVVQAMKEIKEAVGLPFVNCLNG
ncbi:acetamidase [Nannizzia gypsea CBS 118893]|uniref:Acetamidase n=1 Tax=Arthroderma gypseum (strain ATCC MYA-4604 / CBS 118893) TaxID=535722 RepID=E4UTT4_ARTGP|nr:acetamidase [Nannizzia gypsea CBS 118893]EFR01577.1 acetamidase [Nannizzia gypsea CBS 118893]